MFVSRCVVAILRTTAEDIFKKLRSLGIATIGSPIGGEGGPSFKEATELTVSSGGDPGKVEGGPACALRTPGLDGALFMRSRSLKECLAGIGLSAGVGGKGPVGGGATGIGGIPLCPRERFEVALPLL